MNANNVPSKNPLVYGDTEVRVDAKGLVSLTDMWHAADKPEGKLEPRLWAQAPREKISGTSGLLSVSGGPGYEFIDFVRKNLNVDADYIYKTAKGRYGGTWAHWQIALAYAKYLSPEFHAWANQVVKERMEEDRSPELGIERSRERAIANWKRQGKSDEYIAARLQGIDQRNTFTRTLATHGVNDGKGIATCTNSIYQPLFGGTASQIRERRGLRQGQNVRDSMNRVELAATMFSEALASDRIERENRTGTGPCASACLKAGTTVAASLEHHKKSIEYSPESQPTRTTTQLTSRIDALRASLK